MGELIQNQSDTTDGFTFTDLAGREIGRYRIQKRLGRGGLTTVYQAYDMVDDFPVALKVLLHGTDEKVYNRFRYEAQTAAKLQHPHIIRTLRVGVAPGSEIAYIAMELVEGEDLATLLASRRRLSAEESCLLLAPIAQALAYAHKRGVIHRDVKPSNILLRTVGAGTPDNVVLESLDYPLVPLLSDFGIARALDVPELTHSGRTVGTPAFMAPEQCLGRRNVDQRADLYALGAVLYRCITGRQPFVGSTVQILHAHVYEPITIEEESLRQLSPIHIQLLQRSLAKDPNDRYQSADEMVLDFQQGARSAADLQLTTDQHEQNTTLTLTLLPTVKATTVAGPSAILVPPAELPTELDGIGEGQRPAAAADVYYDPVLDRRLRRASRIVLFVLILLLALFFLFSRMNFSWRELWQPLTGWLPLENPVLAYQAERTAAGPVMASGSGDIRLARGVVGTSSPQAYPRVPMTLPLASPEWTEMRSITLAVRSGTLSAPLIEYHQALSTTLTPTPTRPILAFPVAEEPCTATPDPLLGSFLAALEPPLQAEFQCAIGRAVESDGALLQFEHGYMLYVYQLNRMFIVSTQDQQWDDLNLVWLDGDTIPLPNGIVTLPEDGVFSPIQMFGKLWENEEIRTRLGAALMPNAARFPVVAQKFPGGWLVLDKERPAELFFFWRGQRRL
ncbi:MAG: serine/threonine protein kinase [Caldilineaceae bacterium]|nr:serine/threonine protein kinase [Caldilineaceae bacterium]